MIERGAASTDLCVMLDLIVNDPTSMPRLGFGALILLVFTACPASDGGPPPSIEGKSKEEAAKLTTDLTCDYVTRCGLAVEDCPDVGPGGVDAECTQKRVELTRSECENEYASDLAEAYDCAELTDELAAKVDDCLAQLGAANQCLTMGDVAVEPDGLDVDALALPAFPSDCVEAFSEARGCTIMTGEPIE